MDQRSLEALVENGGVRDVLRPLLDGIARVLGDRVVGIYLTGSLSYGAFEEGRSDIDLAVLTTALPAAEALDALHRLHLDVERAHPRWAKRIECSYVPVSFLGEVMPPRMPRPYFGAGTFYREAPYGDEWLINQYLLARDGIALVGPEFRTLVAPIDVEDVREACLRDLLAEWEPKRRDAAYLEDSHQQSYVVLNLCRILFTVARREVASKAISAAWVQQTHPEWRDLIEAASRWRYGATFRRQEEVRSFIGFVVAKVGCGAPPRRPPR